MDSARRIAERRAGMALALSCLFSLLPASLVHAAKGDCGQPSSTGATPKSSDALFALKTAVGTVECDLCVCDVTNDAKVTSTDALRILKKAVGQDVALSCPACTPNLTGVVRMPASVVSSAQWASRASGLTGLVPVEGATVELLNVDATGVPLLPPIATTTSKADGSYTFQPVPAPSSTTVVRATFDGEPEHAFVTGNMVDVDVASEFVFGTTVGALGGEPGAGLGDLSLAEIDALVTLVRQVDVDLGEAMSVQGALERIDDDTGGVYREYVADFATDSGPVPALSGEHRIVTLGLSFARSFASSTPSSPSVNTRSVHAYTTGDPLAVDVEGAVTQAATTGRSHTLVEVSGTSQSSGAINATAALYHADVSQSPGAATGTLLAAYGGRLLANTQGLVAAGIVTADADFGILPTAARPTADAGLGAFALLLRQGAGLSNGSLSATYWAVQFELEFGVNSPPGVVHREVEVLNDLNTMTFDGGGNLSLTAPSGRSILMVKENPLPGAPAADVAVSLAEFDTTDDPVAGLNYTLSPTGALTVKAGAEPVATGAVTPDRNIIVLTTGDESGTDSASTVVIGIRRGSGMNAATASGRYRSMDVSVFLNHDLQPGTIDVAPSSNNRSTGFSAAVGSFEMDGAGTVSVNKSALSHTGLGESSGVQAYSSQPDVVLDAGTSILFSTDGRGDNTETHAYTVASNGKVTVDGERTGFLSPDGEVFVLAIGEAGPTRLESGLLIGIRDP